MTSLNNELTCTHMHDECDSVSCPKREACEHHIAPISFRAIILRCREHVDVLDFLTEHLECHEDVPDGLLATVSILRESIVNTVDTLHKLAVERPTIA